MHVTDESGGKDVLELAGAIVMVSSDQKKIYDSKSLKTIIRMKSFSDNFIVKLMMRPKSLYQKTRSVVKISSKCTSSVRLKRSLEFLTL